MADVPPPKRARTAPQEPPSVTPADVAPEAQSGLAAFLARPAAARTPPGKAKSPGPLPPGLAAAAAASLERCWAELPPADASVEPRPDPVPRHDSRDTQARPRPGPGPSRDARRDLPRFTTSGARGARRRAADARKKDADALAAPGARAGARDRRRAGAGTGPGAGGPPAPDGARERAAARARAGRGGAAPALVTGPRRSVLVVASSLCPVKFPCLAGARRPRRKLYWSLMLLSAGSATAASSETSLLAREVLFCGGLLDP